MFPRANGRRAPTAVNASLCAVAFPRHVMPEARRAPIAAITRGAGGAMIVDEIYHGLVYDGDYPTALRTATTAFVTTVFFRNISTEGAGGWAWMVVLPDAYVREFDSKSSSTEYLPFGAVQFTTCGVAAFEPATFKILEKERPARSQGAPRFPGYPLCANSDSVLFRSVPPARCYIYDDCQRARTGDILNLRATCSEPRDGGDHARRGFSARGPWRRTSWRLALHQIDTRAAEGCEGIGA